MIATEKRPTRAILVPWPWQHTGAVFAPGPGLIERGWLDGAWRQSLEVWHGQPCGDVTRIHDGRGRPIRVTISSRAGGRRPREIELTYDAEGRLLSLVEVDATRAYRLAYRYDGEGLLVSELRDLRRRVGSPSDQVHIATHHRDEAGRLLRVEVRDDAGGLVAESSFNRRGQVTEAWAYDRHGGLIRHESNRYLPGGRIEQGRCLDYEVDRPSGTRRPARLQTEEFEYDGTTRQLTRRLLLVQTNPDLSGGATQWRTTIGEVIDYESGRPARDETWFLDTDPGSLGGRRHHLLLETRHDDRGRLIEQVATERDPAGDRVRIQRTQHVHRSRLVDDPPAERIIQDAGEARDLLMEIPPPSVAGIDPDLLILHESCDGGEPTRRLYFEGRPLRLAGVTAYYP